MRNYNDKYRYIICDIDDTLVYGWFTDLMRITWDVFRNNTLSDFLMEMQNKFNLYKVNPLLKYILNNYDGQILFLTARKECEATIKLVYKILELSETDEVLVVALSTDHPEIDKIDFIEDLLPYGEVCVFDDNKKVLEECRALDVDAFDARDFIDKKIG